MRRPSPARYAAPVAFLAAVTVAIVLVRSGLDGREGAAPTPATVLETTATTTEAQPAPTTTAAATTAVEEAVTHEIGEGDTLDKIAIQFDTTVEELLALNPDIDPNALQLGQSIRVK
ncbi:MAG TPA: LysM domain-containing protein [Gaiellaceae bacterium]|nr:LysM domain-containing protein [Gaiellaceae bacterium]